MLKHIRVIPLAAESFGVRSMCTYVETPGFRILLDAGVSLCPKRFGLPPHPEEFKAIEESRRKIAEAAEKVEVVTISHYHNDHHTPSFEDWLCNWTEAHETANQIYEGKTVLAKNPRDHINYSQRQRGWMFQRTSGKHAKKVENADGNTFTFGETKVEFSQPVFHGPENSELGWVLMATIEFRGEKFLFAPDIQGPMSTRAMDIISKIKPDLMMIGGPPLYLSKFRVDEHQIKSGIDNLQKIAESVPYVILEHHLLRDENWHEKVINAFYSAYKCGHTMKTAAEFLGLKNNLLEAQRRKLFAEKPPSREFETWMRLSEDSKRQVRPPL
jgi:predicted metallo-beta-lactamase superfamily hydrolase